MCPPIVDSKSLFIREISGAGEDDSRNSSSIWSSSLDIKEGVGDEVDWTASVPFRQRE